MKLGLFVSSLFLLLLIGVALAKVPAGSPPGAHTVAYKIAALAHRVNEPLPNQQDVTLDQDAEQASAAPADTAGISQARILPLAGSPLPIMSIIGFGVLVGGLWSARKPR